MDMVLDKHTLHNSVFFLTSLVVYVVGSYWNYFISQFQSVQTTCHFNE